jgi:hypothetical protein
MKTLALVIGNNDYYGQYKLYNPINDATGIRNVFERLGYDVIFKTNGDSKSVVDLLTEFEERIKFYDASIFYFAGHGFEVDGENYLAFIECQVDHANSYHCKQTCIMLADLLLIYKKNLNKINIAIIDACRKSFERSGVIATSPFQSPKGTLLAFSTSPNEGASDVGFDGNSIFTGALLKYIGRERLSVEELFKKVRKTVYNLTSGKQTTWEHTSLIGDFFFNIGQLVYSLEIPYSEDVVKDINYSQTDDFGQLILKFRTYNWDMQNPAIEKILAVKPSILNKNQQFVLGRNLLQASGAAFEAQHFMKSLPENLKRYQTPEGDNHLLNGILFEIYFNPQGEFRKDKTKKHYFDQLIKLRKDDRFIKSFEFIRKLLLAVDYPLIYIPKKEDEVFDIDIVANNGIVPNFYGDEKECQIISKMTCNSVNIINEVSELQVYRKDEAGLKSILANFLTCPDDLIQINSNIELSNIIFSIEEESGSAKW